MGSYVQSTAPCDNEHQQIKSHSPALDEEMQHSEQRVNALDPHNFYVGLISYHLLKYFPNPKEKCDNISLKNPQNKPLTQDPKHIQLYPSQ